MVLFFGQKIKTAITISRLLEITQIANKIMIAYDNGEVDFIDDTCSRVAPKIKTVSVTYDSVETATNVLRAFYVACYENKGAFSF